MPANAKYLTASPWQRFAKISAALVGGYMVAMSFHVALAAWTNHGNVLITSAFSGFIIWTVLMILAFLSKNGWQAWLVYAFFTVLFLSVAYIGKFRNPEFL